MRKYYQRRLPENPIQDYYFIHRLTGATQPILVEYGFIDNANDAKKLQTQLETYGEAVVKALAEYTNTPYTPPEESFEEEVSGDYYVVKPGDTLYSIAIKYNIPVEKLKTINNITSNVINIGQKLLIKETTTTPSVADTYTVKAGDTLYSIANNFSIPVDELKSLNNITTNVITIGQILKIKPSTGSTNKYIVIKGDSLYSIARKFNTTVDDIIKANNLKTINLQIGDVLLIPNNDTNMYIVKKGDSLYSIAKEFNTTIDNLKTLNNLTSDTLSIGQSLNLK